jgi:peroxiredoxin
MLGPGSTAPDFTLRSTVGDPITLSQYKGEKPVVLVFVPFAFTGVCQGELCEIRDDLQMFSGGDKGAQVLVVTCDSSPVQKKWAEEQGFGFPLLTDFWPHGDVSRSYQVFNDQLGCAMRATFVIDTEGTIVASFESGALGTPRSKSDYEAALAKL